MDPAPRSFSELPPDGRSGVPVPFACLPGDAGTLDRRRVVQCALSRVCGVCGASLGRPLAFLGSPREVSANAFVFPPTHLGCAEALLAASTNVADALFGQDEPPSRWMLLTTASFEFVRPDRADEQPTFQPNGTLGQAPAPGFSMSRGRGPV